MHFLISSLLTATAAFGSIASAAPSLLPRAETSTDLPARFALYVASDAAWSNGQRVKYGYDLSILPARPPLSPTVDAYFLGGNGQITLDPAVHGKNTTQGAWNLLVFPGVDQLTLASEEWQRVIKSWPGEHPFVTGKFVQNTAGMLRLVRDGGVLQNGLRLCGGQSADGVGLGPVAFWWDNLPYLDCPEVQFRVVAV